MNKKGYVITIVVGVVMGLAALLLGALGNPGNMGFCTACFLRDIAGALGFHSAGVVQAVRPEIIGLVLGSLIMALSFREFKPTGGSSPVTRFFIGVFVMIGALMFLGCPLRMLIRLGGGDWNALLGLGGFAGGILLGVVALKKGFTLRRAYKQGNVEGLICPAALVVFFVLSLLLPQLFRW
ncbi:MAG: YedE-related selenium metabolism membrane protein, partial [Clostridiales bacterium]|nr:YedE-related selenium metabolism membrane protein [Clostridiales bacterium]